jgi:hypothetical protein
MTARELLAQTEGKRAQMDARLAALDAEAAQLRDSQAGAYIDGDGQRVAEAAEQLRRIVEERNVAEHARSVLDGECSKLRADVREDDLKEAHRRKREIRGEYEMSHHASRERADELLRELQQFRTVAESHVGELSRIRSEIVGLGGSDVPISEVLGDIVDVGKLSRLVAALADYLGEAWEEEDADATEAAGAAV